MEKRKLDCEFAVAGGPLLGDLQPLPSKKEGIPMAGMGPVKRPTLQLRPLPQVIGAGFQNAIAFGVLVVVLPLRPQGLLGRQT